MGKTKPSPCGFLFIRAVGVLERIRGPRQDANTYIYAAPELAPGLRCQIERITEAVGGGEDQAWWTQYSKRLGSRAVDRGLGLLLGLLKEARHHQEIKNPGGMLTWLFQKIAREQEVSLN